MGLTSQVVPAGDITGPELQSLLSLMQTYYLNVDPRQFQLDLQGKDKIILLREDREVRGFSTWALEQHQIGSRTINVIFSGDTIIDRQYWRSLALPIAWGSLMLSVLEQYPDRDLYWVLTSKGYKTYRFLPVFFLTFYPCLKSATPAFETALLNDYSSHKFPARFNPLTGVLAALEGAQRLAPGIAEITETRRKDPHVRFFEKANPNHAKGDELVCLVPCRPDNIRPCMRKYLRP